VSVRAGSAGPAVRRSRALRRLRRRRRLAGLVRLLVFVIVLAVAAWAGVRVAHAGDDASIYTGTRYEVRAGDTLWGIATRRYDDSVDIRRAIYDIRRASGLGTAALQPGDVLVLPREGE
jgi:nucleoid-associated protein YgaU